MTRTTGQSGPGQEIVGSATHALLRHFAAGIEGEWDFIELRPSAHAEVVCLAACEFALRMDFGCAVGPATDGEPIVRVLSGGRRSRIAQLLHQVSLPRDVGVWLRGVYHVVRSRLHRVAAGDDRTGEIDMVLALPIPAEHQLKAPAPVRFEAVEAALALRQPRRYASYGVDVEHRVTRGDLCFVGKAGQRIMFRMWLSLDQSFIGERSSRLRGFQPAGYVYDSHTDPAWRGSGIYGASLHWVGGRLGSSVAYLSLSVHPSNRPAIRAALKAGFRAVDTDVGPGPLDAHSGASRFREAAR